jgi:tRNA-dihydrouridine synthase
MIRDTGCQGVMIGRGALSTPWLFRDAWHYLQTGQKLPAPTEPEMIATVRRFFDLMLEQRDQRYAMFQIRRRISWFAKRLQRQLDNGKVESVKPLKEAVRTAATPSDIHTILDRFLAGELRGGWFEMEEAEQA